MSKKTKDNILGFVAMAIVAGLMAWMVIRDIDRDVERMCGYERFENAPQMCVEWWDDKGVKKNPAIELHGFNGTQRQDANAAFNAAQ